MKYLLYVVFLKIHAFHVVTCTLFVNCPVPNFSRNLSGIQQRMWNIAHLNNWMIYASPPFLTSMYVDSRWVLFEKNHLLPKKSKYHVIFKSSSVVSSHLWKELVRKRNSFFFYLLRLHKCSCKVELPGFYSIQIKNGCRNAHPNVSTWMTLTQKSQFTSHSSGLLTSASWMGKKIKYTSVGRLS